MFVLQSFIGYTFGIFFGALCRDAASATALIPLALIPMLVFAGLAVNIETMP